MNPGSKHKLFWIANAKDKAVPILQVNSEESLCVRMKCNTVLQGKAFWYYTTVNVLCISRTPTCSEDIRQREEFVLR